MIFDEITEYLMSDNTQREKQDICEELTKTINENIPEHLKKQIECIGVYEIEPYVFKPIITYKLTINSIDIDFLENELEKTIYKYCKENTYIIFENHKEY